MGSSKDNTPDTAPVIRATSCLCLNSPLLPSNYCFLFVCFFAEGRMVSYMEILWGTPTTPVFFTFLRVTLISARSSVMKYCLWFTILAMDVCVCVCVCVCKGLAVSELSTWPFHCDISYPTSQGGRMALYQLLGMSMPTIHSEIRKVLQMDLQIW